MREVNVYGITEDLETQPPTVDPSGISYSSGVISWTRGDGDGVVVVISSRPITFLPKNNITYPKGVYVSLRESVIYRGDGSSVEFELQSGLVYFVAVFEFNGRASNEKYFGEGSASVNPGIDNNLLMEDGQDLLLEDGGTIILE
jgi:hypothetical protein